MDRVLIIEDEDDIRLLIRLVLERAGYSTAESASGSDGLAALDREVFDVLILDLRLPDITGWQVLSEIRERGLLPHLKVLVLSAHAEPSAAERALAAGGLGYCRKPFRPEDLVTAVRDMSRT